MKRGLLGILILLSLTSLTSAAYGYYNYSSFSLSDFFNTIQPSTLILGVIFIICFAFVNFALGKFFKDAQGNPNRAIAGIVSLAVSLLIVYWVNRSGFYFDFAYNGGIGISLGALWTIGSIAFPILFIIIGMKYGWGMPIMLSGILLIITSALSYQAYIGGIIGVILIIFGGYLWNKRRIKRNSKMQHIKWH